MPSAIPYEPSLTLGTIVKKEKLEKNEQIAEQQAPVDGVEITEELIDDTAQVKSDIEKSAIE